MLLVIFFGLCGICGRIEIIRDRVYNKNWKSFMGWGLFYRFKRIRWVFFYLFMLVIGRY